MILTYNFKACLVVLFRQDSQVPKQNLHVGKQCQNTILTNCKCDVSCRIKLHTNSSSVMWYLFSEDWYRVASARRETPTQMTSFCQLR